MKTSLNFLSLPNAPVGSSDVLILPVPYERTVTFKPGTAGAPEAVLAASEQLEFHEEDRNWCPTSFMTVSVLPEVAAVAAQSEQAFHQHLSEVTGSLPDSALLIALGGEHSITPDMVIARMPRGGTIVQLDAHADLRASYQGSIYNHACPMFRLRSQGYQLLQIGIRSLHATEAAAIALDEGITTFFDRDLARAGRWQELLGTLASLSGPVWLTIDMDGFDPALVAGVGTPQPGGLSWHQGLDLIEVIMNNHSIDLRGADIVELVPEASRVSDMMAAKLVQKLISYWGWARDFHQRPATGSQQGVEDE